MSRVAGIIGGVGPESTIEYYRAMVAGYRARAPDGGYPHILIDSIDLKGMLDLIAVNRLAEVAEYLVAEIHKLTAAGADFGFLACNTLHVTRCFSDPASRWFCQPQTNRRSFTIST